MQQSGSSRRMPSSPHLQAQTEGTGNINALLGMGLASLGLLCIIAGMVQGANLLLSVLGGLLVLRLLALCYSSYCAARVAHVATNSELPSYQVATRENVMYVPNGSATAFASSEAPMKLPLFSNSVQSIGPAGYSMLHLQQGQYLQRDIHAPIAQTSDIPYVPIEQDELFQLDTPLADEYILYLPKEGEALVECQDRFALDTVRRCYAIADGVSGSFASGPWARIVARGFVEYVAETLREIAERLTEQGLRRTGQCFEDSTQFEQWLQQCRNAWYRWMRERWVPTMNAMRTQQGNDSVNWDIEIEQGAQTTLTGCWLRTRADSSDPYIDIYVSIIGDSAFFLFRRDEQGQWQNIAALPFLSVDEFGSYPTVLATRPQAELVERAWTRCQERCVPALPGDRIILATDILAKWILAQLQHQETAWTLLLDSTDSSLHERLLRQELHENRMEDDDLTMLVIPVYSSQR